MVSDPDMSRKPNTTDTHDPKRDNAYVTPVQNQQNPPDDKRRVDISNFRNTRTYKASAGSIMKDCLFMCNVSAPWKRKLDDACGNTSLDRREHENPPE
jgi:hypothetical protein